MEVILALAWSRSEQCLSVAADGRVTLMDDLEMLPEPATRHKAAAGSGMRSYLSSNEDKGFPQF